MSTSLTDKEAALLETLKTALGDHLADVLDVMRSAINALYQTEALFASIKDLIEMTNSPCFYAKSLAEAGVYISQDIANFIDLQHEKVRDSLLTHGIYCGAAE